MPIGAQERVAARPTRYKLSAGGRARGIPDVVELLPDEMKRYLTTVFFVGVATTEADGPIFGSNSSPQESARLDTILYSLGLGFAGTEDVLMSWIGEGG